MALRLNTLGKGKIDGGGTVDEQGFFWPSPEEVAKSIASDEPVSTDTLEALKGFFAEVDRVDAYRRWSVPKAVLLGFLYRFGPVALAILLLRFATANRLRRVVRRPIAMICGDRTLPAITLSPKLLPVPIARVA